MELEKWNNLLGQLLDSPLPQGAEWLEHLALLGAVRIKSFTRLHTIKEMIVEACPGYVDVGILKGSENHWKAISLLAWQGLPLDILVEHDLNKDYLRVNLLRRDMIDGVRLGASLDGPMCCLTNSQRDAIESLYDLYVQDESLRRENISKFIEEWDKWPSLRALRLWWDAVKEYPEITSIGSVLAQANAERIGLLERRKPSA